MCKSEIFAKILNLVGKETEVSTELILSSTKVTEVVDARSIVVFFLTEYGLYPEQIAALLHKTSSEMRGGGMGFRENGHYDSDGMNERRMPGYFPESPMYGDMGERRRRRSNGEFY